MHRIWRAHRLQPHRYESFKLSRDPDFASKVRDVVGLYLNPPDKALVLCVDEKSQIQELDRTQPVLPLRPGIPARQTHDYDRHGTTTLFAARNILDGSVIGSCLPRHRHGEFIKFLDRIETSTPRRREIHLVLDNYGTHKHLMVKQSFSEHPRYHLRFYTDQRVVAESGRALVRGDHTQAHLSRNLHQRARLDLGDPRVHADLQSQSQAVQPDRHAIDDFAQGKGL